MKRFRKIQKYLAVLLLSAFVLSVYNNTFNVHTHLLPDGRVIVHAHPFAKSHDGKPVKNHSHTSNDFALISAVNHFLWVIIFILFIFNALYRTSRKLHLIYRKKNSHSVRHFTFLLRAPPGGNFYSYNY